MIQCKKICLPIKPLEMNVWLKSDCLVTETFYFFLFLFASSVIIHYKEKCKSAHYSARMCRPVGFSGADPGALKRGVHVYNSVCVCGGGGRFADIISFFLNIPWKGNNLVSVRPNYFIFIGYLKT